MQREYQISAMGNGKTSTQAVTSFTSTQAVNNKIYTGSQWHQTYTITDKPTESLFLIVLDCSCLYVQSLFND